MNAVSLRSFFLGGGHIKEFPINEQITDSQLRVIDENGQMIGIISAQEALALAEEKELDLVKVSPEANPPVCKILDYGKFRYEMSKKEKESKNSAGRTRWIKRYRFTFWTMPSCPGTLKSSVNSTA